MSSNSYYLGTDPQTRLGDTPRFFYGLRRGEDGSVYLVRSDQMKDSDIIQMNEIGNEEENYNDLDVGVDFFEGRDVYHNKVYENLRYEQYRWDDRAMFYYVDEDGQLVVRINNGYTYESLTAP
jgi:hypothetical protein